MFTCIYVITHVVLLCYFRKLLPKLLALIHLLDGTVKSYSKWPVVLIIHGINANDHLDLELCCRPGCLKVNLKKYGHPTEKALIN